MTILAIDQGTTGTTTILFDEKGGIIDKAYCQFNQIYPQPGWVEHDPEEIWDSVYRTTRVITNRNSIPIKAVGITNQRETTILWDKTTGRPIYNAIVWQCRRTSEICKKLNASHGPMIHKLTGLTCDPYFSGTKIKWILDNCHDYILDNLVFGTVDTWLIWKLTNGRVHATDYTNASRTLIFNINEKKWDEELCSILGIPVSILPEVKKSIDHFGEIESVAPLNGIPILGVAGDQQAALFGQTCFNRGQMKNTYGTGSFVVMNTGNKPKISQRGLITTLAIDGNGEPCYALEGSIFIAGAAIQWLRDELHLIKSASESETAAVEIKDNGGVYLVPAFVGLGAPWWDSSARGTIVGLTRGSNKNHIIRAALESMAYQTEDILKVMKEETDIQPDELFVDGGATANNFCMQFQADISNISVVRPTVIESTALGAAFLAGLNADIWKHSQILLSIKSVDSKFRPGMDQSLRASLLKGWKMALRQTRVKDT
ncbi:MAG: glycerol kinase GlpK [Chitinispirillia bacterium]|jgi:glycerol kinase